MLVHCSSALTPGAGASSSPSSSIVAASWAARTASSGACSAPSAIAATAPSGSSAAARKEREVARTIAATRSGSSAMSRSLATRPVPRRFIPKSAKGSASTSSPVWFSMVGAWSWWNPWMASTLPSMRAAILPAASTLTTVTSAGSTPLSSSHAGNVPYIASPGVPPTVLPTRSAGSAMPWSAKNSTELGPVCRKTPTLRTGIPELIALASGGVSAHPKSVLRCATCWTVFPDPFPAGW